MKKKISQKEFIRLVAKRSNEYYTIEECMDVLELVLSEIEYQVGLGNNVELTSFGTFRAFWNEARMVPNLQEGGLREIGNDYSLKFSASRMAQKRLKAKSKALRGRMERSENES